MTKSPVDTAPPGVAADNLSQEWPSAFLSSIIETQSDIAAVELDTGIVMQMIVERTRALTGAEGAAIDVVEGDQVICRAASGLGADASARAVGVASSLSGRTARSGEIFHSGDIQKDGAADDSCHAMGIRSVVYVPLAYNGQVVGVLRMLSERKDAFDDRAIASLRLMAGLLAAALEHASEFEIKKKLLAERTDALARLRESEERFRSACENAPIGMAIVSLEGAFVEVNRSLCRIVGYGEAELLAKDFQSITHPDDLQPDLHNVNRLVEGRSDSYQMLKRYIRKDRRVVWVLLNVSLVKDSAGKPKYFISQVQDITQRQLAEWLEEDRRRALEMVAKDQPLQQVLVQLAVSLERQMSDSVAAVLLLQDGQITVHGTDRSAGWLAGLRYRCLPRAMELSAHFWSAPDACGYTDLRSDEPWKELRAEAAEAGLRACWTMPVTATDGAMMGMILLFSNQSRRPSAEERIVIDSISQLATLCIEHQNTTRQLAHLVRHDSLTSLPNRLLFEDRVQQALALSRTDRKHGGPDGARRRQLQDHQRFARAPRRRSSAAAVRLSIAGAPQGERHDGARRRRRVCDHPPRDSRLKGRRGSGQKTAGRARRAV